MGEAIKYLYRNFLLRDVLSVITPGAIVTLTAFLIFLPELSLNQRIETLFSYSHSFHWLLYIPIFGIFYMIGFANECLGRLFGFIRIHKLDDGVFKQRLSLFYGKLHLKKDIYQIPRKASFSFLRTSDKQDWAEQNYERLVVLKQMCINNFFAIIIACLFLIFDICPSIWANISIVSIFILLLLISLLWGYRDFEIAVNTMENNISSLNEGEKESKKEV